MKAYSPIIFAVFSLFLASQLTSCSKNDPESQYPSYDPNFGDDNDFGDDPLSPGEEEESFAPFFLNETTILFEEQNDWSFYFTPSTQQTTVKLNSDYYNMLDFRYTYSRTSHKQANLDFTFSYEAITKDYKKKISVNCILTFKLTFISYTDGIYEGSKTLETASGQKKTYTVTGKFTFNKTPGLSYSYKEWTEWVQFPADPVIPTEPSIPANAIGSKITKISSDEIAIDYNYDKSLAKSITQMGYCWSTSSHPTTSDKHTPPFKLVSGNGVFKATAQFKLQGQPGTNYYIRAYALVGSKFIYFDEMTFQTVGKDIKLSTYYAKDKEEIAIEYAITRSGTYELCFYAPLLSSGNRVVDESLSYIDKGSGIKYVPDYNCAYYYAYLKEISTGIIYYSNTVYKAH